jgi:pyruvate ferredoxin oxidoreductase beta subunit
VMTVPASCLTVLGGMYPISSVEVPWVNMAFPSTAAAATGLAAGLRAMGRAGEMTVLAMAGDGGTSDIGIQGLSGAAERNEDFIYLCYDNEAYMNTGTQRSGLTPAGARTTTTWSGKRENPKDLPRIMEAHDVPYVASTSAAYPTDVYDKVVKARGIHGLRYIHMNVPCPSGWGFDPKDTVRLGKMAVDAGLVVLYEIEDGRFSLTGRSAALAKSSSQHKDASAACPRAASKRSRPGSTGDGPGISSATPRVDSGSAPSPQPEHAEGRHVRDVVVPFDHARQQRVLGGGDRIAALLGHAGVVDEHHVRQAGRVVVLQHEGVGRRGRQPHRVRVNGPAHQKVRLPLAHEADPVAGEHVATAGVLHRSQVARA